MKNSHTRRKSFSLLAMAFSIILASPKQAEAQINLYGTNYHQTFDSLSSGIPAGWSVDTGTTSTYLGHDVSNTFFYSQPATNTGWGNATGRFKNVASGTAYAYYANGGTSANQIIQPNRALGVRQTVAIDSKIGFVFSIANTVGLNNFELSFTLQSLDSTSGRVSTWKVDYGLGTNPAAFTSVTATGNMTTGGYRFSKDSIHVSFGNALNNQNGPVYIRIVSLNPTTGPGSRTTTAIDDYNLSWNGAAGIPSISIKEKTPEGLNIPLATNGLKIKYSQPIEEATGQIELFKSGNMVPYSIPVPSSVVTINDSVVSISGINLENNTSYYVLMPAGSFKSIGDTLYNQAILDSTSWSFSTVDTTTATAPANLTQLNETFSNCINTTLGNFVQYSAKGMAKWHCITEGRNDSAAVTINGGAAAGSSEENEDWLITAAPIDLSQYWYPNLSFWQKRKFEGNVSRSVKLSTDYTTGMNPANATWNTLEIPDFNAPTVDVWSLTDNIPLHDYSNTPFYLAFTYACGIDGAYELSYDDINIKMSTGIWTPVKGNIVINVLGEATADKVMLQIYLAKNADLKIQMFDMQGTTVYQHKEKGKQGHQVYVWNDKHFKPGLYIIRIFNGESYGTIKLSIKQ
jgi:hypothetical protein